METELGRSLGHGADTATEQQRTGARLSCAGGREEQRLNVCACVGFCRTAQGLGVAGRGQDGGATTETAEHHSRGTEDHAAMLSCYAQARGTEGQTDQRCWDAESSLSIMKR